MGLTWSRAARNSPPARRARAFPTQRPAPATIAAAADGMPPFDDTMTPWRDIAARFPELHSHSSTGTPPVIRPDAKLAATGFHLLAEFGKHTGGFAKC